MNERTLGKSRRDFELEEQQPNKAFQRGEYDVDLFYQEPPEEVTAADAQNFFDNMFGGPRVPSTVKLTEIPATPTSPIGSGFDLFEEPIEGLTREENEATNRFLMTGNVEELRAMSRQKGRGALLEPMTHEERLALRREKQRLRTLEEGKTKGELQRKRAANKEAREKGTVRRSNLVSEVSNERVQIQRGLIQRDQSIQLANRGEGLIMEDFIRKITALDKDNSKLSPIYYLKGDEPMNSQMEEVRQSNYFKTFTHYVTSIVAEELNAYSDFSLITRSNSGRLYVIMEVPFFFISETMLRYLSDYERKEGVEIPGTTITGNDARTYPFFFVALYNVQTVAMNIFATLTITYNSHLHSLFQTVDGSDTTSYRTIVLFIAKAYQYLLNTGALAGMTMTQVEELFRSFKIDLSLTHGAISEGKDGGLVFTRLLLGPYPVRGFFSQYNLNTDEQKAIADQINDDMIRAFNDLYFRYGDNEDIADWKGEQAEDNPKQRRERAEQRVEEISLKLFPYELMNQNEQLTTLNVVPMHFNTIPIQPSEHIEKGLTVEVLGNKPARKLDPRAYIKPTAESRLLDQETGHSIVVDNLMPYQLSANLSSVQSVPFITALVEPEKMSNSNAQLPYAIVDETRQTLEEKARRDTLGMLEQKYHTMSSTGRDSDMGLQLRGVGERELGEDDVVEAYREIYRLEPGMTDEAILRQLQQNTVVEIEPYVRAEEMALMRGMREGTVGITESAEEFDNLLLTWDHNYPFLIPLLYRYFRTRLLEQLLVDSNVFGVRESEFNLDQERGRVREKKDLTLRWAQFTTNDMRSTTGDSQLPEDVIQYSSPVQTSLTAFIAANEKNKKKPPFNAFLFIPESTSDDFTLPIEYALYLQRRFPSDQRIKLAFKRGLLQLMETLLRVGIGQGVNYQEIVGQVILQAEFFIRRVTEERYGCIVDPDHLLEKSLLRKKEFIYCPAEEEAKNCVIHCVGKFMGQTREERNLAAFHLRRKLQHYAGLRIDDCQLLADYYGVRIKCYKIKNLCQDDRNFSRQSQTIDKMKTFRPKKEVKKKEYAATYEQKGLEPPLSGSSKLTHVCSLLFFKKHCYWIRKPGFVLNKAKCSICTQWINLNSFQKHSERCHYCRVCRHAYTKKGDGDGHVCKPRDYSFKKQDKRLLMPQKLKEGLWKAMKNVTLSKRKVSDNNIWFADMETFPDSGKDDNYTVYACGLINAREGKPRIFYGKDCIVEYFKFLDTNVKGTLFYYNGSGFDNFLHLQGLVDLGYYIDSSSFIRCNGRIIAFNHSKHLKVRDLFLFLKQSLARACKSWGVPQDKSKRDFDHSRVYDWLSALRCRKEVEEYLEYDVIALKTLYQIYSRAMFDSFHIDITRAITPSQYSLICWSSTCKDIHEIYIPHAGKEATDDRAAYYGGRVCCQYREYVSEQYDAFTKGECKFDDIKDYLGCIDANSLYPAAQYRNQFAFGKWKYILVQSDVDHARWLQLFDTLGDEEAILRSMFLVDVTCPGDLLTAFLLARDPSTSKLVQDLEPKTRQWYWGCELIEARILGYSITRVHEVKQFERREFIFQEFVAKCWQGRKDNPPPNIRNLTYKQAMNELTGKFGQRVPKTNSFIYTPQYQPRSDKNVGSQEQFQQMMKSVVDFTVIWDKKNATPKATIFEIENECLDPSYPIYLSAQILAYARVHMSRAMRICNAYLDPTCAIYYTDTDSLVLPAKCIPLLDRAGMIGKELGQFSCDLSSFENKVFAKILVGIFAATKGPYSLGFICPPNDCIYNNLRKGQYSTNQQLVVDGCLLEKTRIKGMPHVNGPYLFGESIQLDMNGMNVGNYKRAKKWLKDPFNREIPSDLIGQRIYMYRNLQGKEERIFAKHINYEMIKHVMLRQGELVCFFGSMKKSLVNEKGEAFQVRPNVVRRFLLKTEWWNNAETPKRIFADGEEDDYQALSYPVGYDPGNEGARFEIDYGLPHLRHLKELI